jgi:regulation of enolase protein 1 (concanavalin A-like superfamily)
MTAKVLTVSNSNGSAKGGVMIRETLATNAVDCLMDIMASNGGENIWRTATGGSCSSVVVSGITPPYWVRVTRSGSKLIGYRSADGTTWTPVATNTITMANSVNIGLFVCSHNNSALCTVTFTNVVASP